MSEIYKKHDACLNQLKNSLTRRDKKFINHSHIGNYERCHPDYLQHIQKPATTSRHEFRLSDHRRNRI